MFSITVTNTMTKSNLWRKDLFYVTVYSPSLREVRAGTQERKLEVGTEAQTVKECCSLVASLSVACLAYVLYHPEAPAQRRHRPSALSLPTSIISQANVPKEQSEGGLCQLILSSRKTLVCVKLTKINQYN